MNDNKFKFVSDEDIADEKVKDSIKIVNTPEKVNVEVNKPEEVINPGVKKRLYFSFEARIVVSILSILILFAGACFLGLRVVNHTTIQDVEYVEDGDFSYIVCFKDTTCLNENNTYVASDIDHFEITFDYKATYEKKVKVNNSYRVAVIVSAYDKKDNSLLYQTKSNLVKKSPLVASDNTYTIKKDVNVDYNKYKELGKEYKDADRRMEVVFYIEEGKDTRKVVSITIPFSSETFNINKYTTSRTVRTSKVTVNAWDTYSLVYVIAASILTIVSLILLYKTTRLVLMVTNNRNEYEDEVERILKEYESIITVFGEGFESIVPDEKDVIKYDNFEDLVKVREEINKPIIYSKINNVKCEFMVEDDKVLYKYVMKEVDFTEDEK